PLRVVFEPAKANITLAAQQPSPFSVPVVVVLTQYWRANQLLYEGPLLANITNAESVTFLVCLHWICIFFGSLLTRGYRLHLSEWPKPSKLSSLTLSLWPCSLLTWRFRVKAALLSASCCFTDISLLRLGRGSIISRRGISNVAWRSSSVAG